MKNILERSSQYFSERTLSRTNGHCIKIFEKKLIILFAAEALTGVRSTRPTRCDRARGASVEENVLYTIAQ